MKIRKFQWNDLDHLSHIVKHSKTPSLFSSDVRVLKSELEIPTYKPTKNIFIVYDNNINIPLGFVFVKPEHNIFRNVLFFGIDSCTKLSLLKELTKAAFEYIKQQGIPIVHLMIWQDKTEAEIQKQLATFGFYTVHRYLKMVKEKNNKMTENYLCYEEKNSSMKVRLMNIKAEIPEFTALQNICFYSMFGFSPNTVEENEARLNLPITTQKVFFAEDKTQRIVGYCWISIKTETNNQPPIGRIEMIGVHPDKRKKGIGMLILKHVIQDMDLHGVQTIYLDVDKENQSAINIYGKLGFMQSSTTKLLEHRFH